METCVVPECALVREHRTVRSRLRDASAVRGASGTGCARCGGAGDGAWPVLSRMRRRLHTRCSWRKCFSFTAACWLVLVVGGLCPGGGAAPTSRRSSAPAPGAPAPARAAPAAAPGRMERTKRADLPIWRNPCGIELDVDKRGGAKGEMDPSAAAKVRNAAHNVLEDAMDYQDMLASEKQSVDWAGAAARCAGQASRLQHPWLQLPPARAPGDALQVAGADREYYLHALENLPAMYKYMELLMGALEKIPASSEFSNSDNPELRERLDNTLFKMRGLLCEFDALLLNRGIRKLKSLEPSEVAERTNNDTQGGLEDILVFRDMLNFLEIMVAIFREMSDNGE